MSTQPTSFQSLYVQPQVNLFAISDMNAEAVQLPLQEELAIAMLDQTIDVIEEQNNAVQAEFAITLQQSQNTILNLQNAQHALLLENAQSRAQVTVLESQNNQMNAAHQADRSGANERIQALEEALRVKSDEVNLLNNTVKIYKKGLSDLEEKLKPKMDLFNHARAICDPSIGSHIIDPVFSTLALRDLINETKKQLSNVSKEKL